MYKSKNLVRNPVQILIFLNFSKTQKIKIPKLNQQLRSDFQ